MPSRRDDICMTPGEIGAYMRQQRRIILITNGANGLPHPVPMNFGLDKEDRIVITSFAKSQKVKNLDRDPRATLLVESGTIYREFKSVIAYCDAEILIDPETIHAGLQHIRTESAMAASLSTEMNEQIRASLAKRVLLRFTPFRHVSWDHGKLGGFY